MADNIQLNLGSGGSVVATDDVGGFHYQLVKLAYGALDAATLVTVSVGLPVDVLDRALRDCGKIDIAAFDSELPAGTQNIGDVDVVTLPSIPTGSNNIGDVDVLTLPSIPAGTNNIGDVDVLTLPSIPAGTNNIGDVDVLTLPSIPAGTNNIGDIDVLTLPAINQHVAPAVVSSTQGPTRINVTASGDTTLLAAPGGGLSIYVTGIMASNQAGSKIRALVREGAAGTIRGGGTLASNGGGYVFPYAPAWKLPANTALVANLSAAGDVDYTVHFFVAA